MIKDPVIPSSFDNWRMCAAFGIFGLFLAVAAMPINNFGPVMTEVPSDSAGLPLYLARLILFIELVALAFRWVVATDHELKIWARWLAHPDETKGRKDANTAIFALWLVLGIMLALAHNIFLISGYFSVTLLVNYWTQWLANDHFKEALEYTRKNRSKELSKDKSWAKTLVILEQYWIKRPQLARLTTMMLIACVAFSFAFAGLGEQSPYKHLLQLTAYALLSLDILIGEIIVSKWRRMRDREIEAVCASEKGYSQSDHPKKSQSPSLKTHPMGQDTQAIQNLTEEQPRSAQLPGIIFALLPILSFVAQRILSARAGTEDILYQHLTVTVVDWVFVPFNYFAVRTIDWRKGTRLYVIFFVSVVLNVLTHAYWQRNGLDSGHMITSTGVTLPAGWVHLIFSILEMVLLVAFVFCRDPKANTRIASLLAVAYFLAVIICGYAMHHGFTLSDVSVFVSGLFFVLFYPRLVTRLG